MNPAMVGDFVSFLAYALHEGRISFGGMPRHEEGGGYALVLQETKDTRKTHHRPELPARDRTGIVRALCTDPSRHSVEVKGKTA